MHTYLVVCPETFGCKSVWECDSFNSSSDNNVSYLTSVLWLSASAAVVEHARRNRGRVLLYKAPETGGVMAQASRTARPPRQTFPPQVQLLGRSVRWEDKVPS